MFTGSLTYYEVLDIPSDASPQDVREAYLRIKSTFTKDSVALYSLVSPEEREDTIRKVEEAYAILSDPEKRRRYDQFHGQLHPMDSSPAMDEQSSDDELLIPPSTDFVAPEPESPKPVPAPVTPPRAPDPVTVAPNAPTAPVPPRAKTAASGPAYSFRSNIGDPRLTSLNVDPTLLSEIEHETEWRGSFFKKVREALGISLEEMAETTKISKTYISAMEEENYRRLPASVYVRGFVIQLAKVLRLPPDKAATAFMTRFKQAQEARESGQS